MAMFIFPSSSRFSFNQAVSKPVRGYVQSCRAYRSCSRVGHTMVSLGWAGAMFCAWTVWGITGVALKSGVFIQQATGIAAPARA